ncbi:hypothetical protein M3Y97_00238400 [Aphelenchoides bicaudatus]|nr:hypothetical protein M3Y97_00238400 [Aphelenchoides bicaudatus]
MISRTRTKVALLLLTVFHQSSASFCGPAAVPFSFESLPDGQPVLGCARPKCFGWNAESKPAASPSTFFRIHNKPDGYFRKSTESQPEKLSAEDAKHLGIKRLIYDQTAKTLAKTKNVVYKIECVEHSSYLYVGRTTNGPGKRLADHFKVFVLQLTIRNVVMVTVNPNGLVESGPLVNVSGLPIALQCCEYAPTQNSADRGIATVNNGQIVIGGEILSGDRLFAFDYISDITKHSKPDGTVSYEVAVRRMPCIPPPTEFTVNLDQPVINEILSRFGKTEKKSHSGSAQAFQAPTQVVSEQTVLQEIGTQEQVTNVGAPQQPAGQGQIVSQVDEQVLVPTGQERVEIIRGPFIAEQDAIVEEVNAIPGFELPEGQVPQGLIEQPVQPVQSAPSYGYASAPSYGYGGGGSSMFCFSADTTVRMSDGETKRMDELNVGDWIQSANTSQVVYTNVKSWIHKMPHVKANFHRIELTDGKTLKLTAKHYIYKTECKFSSNKKNFKQKEFAGDMEDQVVPFNTLNQMPVYAEKVEAGDCLYVLSDKQQDTFEQRRVQKVDIVQDVGIYAPLTSNGDLIVNDIYSSCYNILSNNILQQSFADNLRALPSIGWIFGENTEAEEEQMVDLPYGTSLIVELMEYVLPSSIYSV